MLLHLLIHIKDYYITDLYYSWLNWALNAITDEGNMTDYWLLSEGKGGGPPSTIHYDNVL